MDWKSHFKEGSITRGEQLYTEGKVSCLRRGREPLTCSARVLDSQSYRLALEMDAQESVTGGDCSCPKAAGGGLCEHIAAMCFAVEARLKETRPGSRNQTPRGPGAAPGRDPGKISRSPCLSGGWRKAGNTTIST